MEDKTIIKLIKNKKEAGLTKLIDTYGNILKGLIAKTLPHHSYLWGEVLNDSLLDIWKNISYYDPNKASLKNMSLMKIKKIPLQILELLLLIYLIFSNQIYPLKNLLKI